MRLSAQVYGWKEQIQPLLRQWRPLALPPPPPWSTPDAEARLRRLQQTQRRLAGEGLWLGGERTLLRVLRIARDETAHSRLLAWLLRPDGYHRAGDAALRALGQAAGVPNSLLSGAVRVIQEEERVTIDRQEGEPPTTRADLVVRTPRVTLLVEAKVDALEQPAQLHRLRRTWTREPSLHVLLIARSSHQQVTSTDGGRWPATSWARLAEDLAERVPPPRVAELDAVLNSFRETS